MRAVTLVALVGRYSTDGHAERTAELTRERMALADDTLGLVKFGEQR